jgi:hypothetical protein
MTCIGYDTQAAHEVDHLHGGGLCAACYHKRYFQHNKRVLMEFQREYQKAYRADESYKVVNRLYVKRSRDKHHAETT